MTGGGSPFYARKYADIDLDDVRIEHIIVAGRAARQVIQCLDGLEHPSPLVDSLDFGRSQVPDRIIRGQLACPDVHQRFKHDMLLRLVEEDPFDVDAVFRDREPAAIHVDGFRLAVMESILHLPGDPLGQIELISLQKDTVIGRFQAFCIKQLRRLLRAGRKGTEASGKKQDQETFHST